MHYVIIMAGGGGTRLWPLSRQKTPKQVQPFLEDQQSLLQKTYSRLRRGFKKEQIYVTTTTAYYSLVKKQLPQLSSSNISLEPERKETAPAIGLAALRIYQRDPTAIITTVGADAYVENEKEYIKVIKLAGLLAKNYPSYTILIGVNPSYPEVGYGYIELGRPVTEIDHHEVFMVKHFIEKPSLSAAQKFLQRWEYLWNPALFTWQVDNLLNLYKKHLPQIYQRLLKIKKALRANKEEVVAKEYSWMPQIAIEYGLLEKIKKIMVIPADFGWLDIGHWRAIHDILMKKTKVKNLVKGDHVGVASQNNLIYSLSNRLVATVGIKDLIIVDTPDALLICRKDKAQEVKKLIQKLEKEGRNHIL